VQNVNKLNVFQVQYNVLPVTAAVS